MSLETIVGTATVISSLAGRFIGYPAQIRLILKTRMVSNLSVTLHTIGFISCLLWTWHGWLQGDWVILLTQGVAGIAATGSMLFLIWRFHPRRMKGGNPDQAVGADGSPVYRVMVPQQFDAQGQLKRLPHPGFERRTSAGQGVWVSTGTWMEPAARQCAQKLRQQGVLAWAVPDVELDG